MTEEDLKSEDFEARWIESVCKEVYNLCAKYPHKFKDVISIATQGVTDYADRQSDKSGRLSDILVSIICKTKNIKTFGNFTNQEIFDTVEPFYRGTKIMEDIGVKLGLEKKP